jgi:phosphoglycolate phosphatase
MDFRALIFDLDGTLADSLEDIADALNAARAEVAALSPVSSSQVMEWVGDGLPTLCRRACPEIDAARLERIISAASRHYARHCVHHTRLYPNILQMLRLLQARGVRMAVLSNKPHALTLAVVDQLAIAPFFHSVVGARDELHRKPSPVVPLEMARAMGVMPAEVCLIGDSEVDIQTARNAGMTIAAAAWGFRGEKKLRPAGPDWLLHDPMEVLSLPFSTPAGLPGS